MIVINSYPCFLIDKIVPMRNRLEIAYTYLLNNIERVNKHSVTIRRLRVVTTCWYWAWSNRISPSKWVGLGSPLPACSVYGDLTCFVHTVNNVCMFSCQCHFYLCNRGPYIRLAFVPNVLSSWNKDIIIISMMNSMHFKGGPHWWDSYFFRRRLWVILADNP